MGDSFTAETEIASLGPWFHNLHLPNGSQTAPNHWLGDFPMFKWRAIADAIPNDLTDWSVLDVGCNAGFYSFELASRGAIVHAIDVDEHYLRQARWAADQFGLASQIQFERLQIYDLAGRQCQYDLVWFMGVLYHLRYPLLGLDIVARRTRRLLVLQSLMVPGDTVSTVPEDLAMEDRRRLNEQGWPKMAFIEKRLARDPTNWWAPNHACIEAMLRTCGMEIKKRPTDETYVCAPSGVLDPSVDAEFEAATGLLR